MARRDPTSHTAFVERLRELVQAAGSARALAKSAGISHNAILLWLKDSEPSRDKLLAVAKAAGVSSCWLAAGVEPKRGLPEGYVILNQLEIRKGESFSGVDHIAAKRSWIESLPGSPSHSALFLFQASDDAMAPMISRGDLVLANTGEREITASGVYVIYPTNARPTLMVRRLALIDDGAWQISCDNPAFTPAVAAETASAAHFQVFGRAIWAGGLL
jgi:phage repressor protein C with HTH and peptisase S24 domain